MRAVERNNYKRACFRRRARRLRQRRFVFVDETAVNSAMTRRCRRAPRGERAHDSAPRNYGSHTSVIGAMGLRGLVATLAVEGAADTLCFDAYAEKVLAPRLRPGDVVVLDNLTAHLASRIEEVAESRGAQVLWLGRAAHSGRVCFLTRGLPFRERGSYVFHATVSNVETDSRSTAHNTENACARP